MELAILGYPSEMLGFETSIQHYDSLEAALNDNDNYMVDIFEKDQNGELGSAIKSYFREKNEFSEWQEWELL